MVNEWARMARERKEHGEPASSRTRSRQSGAARACVVYAHFSVPGFASSAWDRTAQRPSLRRSSFGTRSLSLTIVEQLSQLFSVFSEQLGTIVLQK